jgi:hypothetical protein
MVVRLEVARLRSTSSAAQSRPEVSITTARVGSATRNDEK